MKKRKAMSTRIVQISDSHISVDHPHRTEELERCVHHINALPEQPDLVIHSGDVTHDGLPEEYTTAKQYLDQLDMPYYVMPGNRDSRPELIKAFADDRHIRLADSWVQYAIVDFPVRLLLIDTVSDESNKGRLCVERLDHLESMLTNDQSIPTVLFMHHPPFEATGVPDPYQYENWDEVTALTTLLSEQRNIRGIYCGHVHRNIDSAVSGIFASAITCLASDLRKGEVREEELANPVLKVLQLE